MKRNALARRLALLLPLLLSLGDDGTAQSMRVNRQLMPHPGTIGTDVTYYELTPDETEVLYFAQLDGGNFGLHAVPVGGGPSRDLPGSPPLSVAHRGGRYVYSTVETLPGGTSNLRVESAPLDGSAPPLTLFERGGRTTASHLISPDGQRVLLIYRDALWSVPIDASSPAVELDRITSSASPTFTVDSLRVVYRLGREIRSVLIDGSSPPITLVSSQTFEGMRSFELTPDSTRVVYLSDQNIADRIELFVRPVDGRDGSIKLNTTPLLGGNVRAFKISPDGNWVAFVADSLFNGRNELFRAPMNGSSAPIVLSGNLVGGGDVEKDLAIDASGAFVYYRADAEVNERFELFAAPASGASAPLKLSGNLASGGDVTSFLVPARGSRVLYRADPEVDERFELYSVPRDASSAALALAGPLPATADVEEGYQASPGGTHAFFRLDRERDDRLQLFARRLDGAAALNQLSEVQARGGDVQADFILSPTAQRIFFRADAEARERFELFSTRLAGEPVRLNPPLAPEPIAADVTDYLAAGNGRVLYRGDLKQDNTFELHSAALDAADDVELNAPLLAEQRVFLYMTTRDGDWTVFGSTQNDEKRLYATRTDGSSPSVAITPDAMPNWSFDAQISPDDRYLVWRTTYTLSSGYPSELYAAPLDGSSSPLMLSPPLAPDQRVGTFLVSASDRVAFTLESGFPFPLESPWSAPLDGSGPALDLAPARPPGRTIDSMWVSPDGGHVVFTAYYESPTTRDLYSVPIDGGQDPVRLNSPLVAGGGVGEFSRIDRNIEISPDSTRIVYVADQDVVGLLELYSVPLDGSSPSIEIVSLSGGSDIIDLEITPDSRHVLYRADAEIDGKNELYLVPIDGSGASVKLNGPMIAAGDVIGAFVTPDSQRVLYLADQEVNDVRAIYSLSLAGGAPVRISDPATVDLRSMRLSPDRAWVAYHRGAPPQGVQDLLLVPSDGSAHPRVVTPGIAGNRTLQAFSFTPDSRRLLYLADQETAGVTELFQCIVGRPLRRR